VLLGLALGIAVSAVLVHVVNPQSFHWTMELRLPWGRLALLCAARCGGRQRDRLPGRAPRRRLAGRAGGEGGLVSAAARCCWPGRGRPGLRWLRPRSACSAAACWLSRATTAPTPTARTEWWYATGWLARPGEAEPPSASR
jgi:hypothetical protein